MANVAFLRKATSTTVIVSPFLAALGQNDVGCGRGGVGDVAVHLGFLGGDDGGGGRT